ncbi:MAG: CocE/NonD family hydrolase [candidate division FCPU426 bacterium]
MLILSLVILAMVVYTSAMFVVALMPARTHSAATPKTFGVEYERVTLTTEDGLELTGWFIPTTRTTAAVVIGHGYPFDKGNILPATAFLLRRFNCLYLDFRAFGESQGKFTTFGYDERKDVAAAMEYLKTRPEVGTGRIGQYGFSLSASIFIQANHPDAKALVADSPFVDFETMMHDGYRWARGPLKLPLIWLSKWYGRIFLKRRAEDASAINAVRDLRFPVLFIHGEQDRQIPPWHSRKLFEACPAAGKEIWLVPGADHGQAMVVQRTAYQERVTEFFHRYLEAEQEKKTP